MEFRGFDAQTQNDRTPSPSSSSDNYSSDQAICEGLRNGRSVGEGQIGPADTREAIQRELEKERIREKIMAEEIARKRLEAEVKREMTMEREAMRSGDGSLAPPPSHNNRIESGMLHGQPFALADRRIARSLQEAYGGSGRPHPEIGGFEAVPFQRLSRSCKVNKITTCLPEDGKKEVIGLGKPSGASLAGAKRKPPSSPTGTGSSELCSNSLKKKPKEEWCCAICEISATCERGLNDHLAGKKHHSKVAALSTQPLAIKNLKIPDSNDLNEDGKTEREQVKQKFMFRCEMCDVEASSEKLMNMHKEGKKHLKKLLELQKAGGQPAAGTTKAHDILREKTERKHVKQKFMFRCEMCDVEASSEKLMNMHKEGKKHLKNLLELQKAGGQGAAGTRKAHDILREKAEREQVKQKFMFRCEMCDVEASSEKLLNMHKEGKKHLKNLLELQKAGVQAASGTTTAHDTKEISKAELWFFRTR